MFDFTTDRGVLVKPSFSGIQSEQVRKVYKKLAAEVITWIIADPHEAHKPEYIRKLDRKKQVTLEHAVLYHKIMKIFRCESKVMLATTQTQGDCVILICSVSIVLLGIFAQCTANLYMTLHFNGGCCKKSGMALRASQITKWVWRTDISIIWWRSLVL